jgi:hypothetical protein
MQRNDIVFAPVMTHSEGHTSAVRHPRAHLLGTAAVLTLVLLPALVAGSAAGRTARSGLYGKVTKGPVSPICLPEKPCYVAAKHAKLRFIRHGHVVKRIQTTAKGRYRLALPAGRYTVRTKRPATIKPERVRVPRNHSRRVDFLIDTGIR